MDINLIGIITAITIIGCNIYVYISDFRRKNSSQHRTEGKELDAGVKNSDS